MARLISSFDVIKKPIVSDKAIETNKNLKKLVLEVDSGANKPMVCAAVKMAFGVDVESVNIMKRKGKLKRSGARYKYAEKSIKIAIVTVKGEVAGSESINQLQSSSEI